MQPRFLEKIFHSLQNDQLPSTGPKINQILPYLHWANGLRSLTKLALWHMHLEEWIHINAMQFYNATLQHILVT